MDVFGATIKSQMRLFRSDFKTVWMPRLNRKLNYIVSFSKVDVVSLACIIKLDVTLPLIWVALFKDLLVLEGVQKGSREAEVLFCWDESRSVEAELFQFTVLVDGVAMVDVVVVGRTCRIS